MSTLQTNKAYDNRLIKKKKQGLSEVAWLLRNLRYREEVHGDVS